MFAENVPKDLIESAKATVMPGGMFDPKKAGFIARLIMKAVTKQSGYVDTIDNDKITHFAEEMKA
jgi:hypothetical protein